MNKFIKTFRLCLAHEEFHIADDLAQKSFQDGSTKTDVCATGHSDNFSVDSCGRTLPDLSR